jgi:hypothetical protein
VAGVCQGWGTDAAGNRFNRQLGQSECVEADYAKHLPKAFPERSFRSQASVIYRIRWNSGQTDFIADVHLIEGWEFDEVVVGNLFYGLSGLAPGAEAAGYYEYSESQFL